MICENEARFIFKCIQTARPASVIGLSNMGKSTLMRELCSHDTRAALLGERIDDFIFAYVDCNLLATCTEQALHAATLRSMIIALRRDGAQDSLLAALDTLHQGVVQPAESGQSALLFERALRTVCEESERNLVLLYDEFDEPFVKLDGRAFLNMRAMKDEYAGCLTYVTATEQPLYQIRTTSDCNEFAEMFSTREVWVGFVNQDDAREIAAEVAAGSPDHAPISKAQMSVIINEAGGHAGLIKAVTETWLRIAGGAPLAAQEDATELVKQALDSDGNVRYECVRIWQQLNDREQKAMIAAIDGQQAEADRDTLDQLRLRRLVNSTGGGDDVLIGNVWRTFVRRQARNRPDALPGVHMDVDSGTVMVDGKVIEPLTDLEYKLLLLLYGRLNKIVDKYTIVTNVWGTSYLDSVDDTRIEKLVSRLRAKLEPGVAEPRCLTTLRGRGYKLVS